MDLIKKDNVENSDELFRLDKDSRLEFLKMWSCCLKKHIALYRKYPRGFVSLSDRQKVLDELSECAKVEDRIILPLMLSLDFDDNKYESICKKYDDERQLLELYRNVSTKEDFEISKEKIFSDEYNAKVKIQQSSNLVGAVYPFFSEFLTLEQELFSTDMSVSEKVMRSIEYGNFVNSLHEKGFVLGTPSFKRVLYQRANLYGMQVVGLETSGFGDKLPVCIDKSTEAYMNVTGGDISLDSDKFSIGVQTIAPLIGATVELNKENSIFENRRYAGVIVRDSVEKSIDNLDVPIEVCEGFKELISDGKTKPTCKQLLGPLSKGYGDSFVPFKKW